MGYYSEYLNKTLSFPELMQERKKQLKIISKLRNREILVFASDLNEKKAEISITYSDLLPIKDQLKNLNGGDKIDFIIETPGGFGEVAEDIVKMLRNKYKEVGMIIPGWAKSAGTIIAMSGDEILMEPSSALGPIDAQLSWNGKTFSAQSLIDGFEKIKEEVEKSGTLNKTYIPILQGISPGEIENANNSLMFSKDLVKKWLVKYKFKNWNKHSSNGNTVTEKEKIKRANEIAKKLCDHNFWKTHARSIKISDFRDMKVKITDYSEDSKLYEAISRYYALLQMTFVTNIYKVFETINSQIYRFVNINNQKHDEENIDNAIIDFECKNCKYKTKIQAKLRKGVSNKKGMERFPENNKFICPNCKKESDLSDIRRNIEARTKKQIVFD